jgi:hypothetical protein
VNRKETREALASYLHWQRGKSWPALWSIALQKNLQKLGTVRGWQQDTDLAAG